MSKAVLDASALLTVLLGERGGEVVVPVLCGATISAVNYSEVVKKFIERGGEVRAVTGLLDRQSLVIVPLDRDRAVAAAALLPQTSRHGLSFADRVCLATGREFGLPVLTAEERMAEPELDLAVTLIRSRVGGAGRP